MSQTQTAADLALADPALALADRWQREFPLAPRPFARLGAGSDLSEREVIEFMQDLEERAILGRIGAAVRPNTAGASTLAAMAVPPEQLDQVAEIVSAEPTVNHNYEREHNINLWFVITAADRDEVDQTLGNIERQTGLTVFDLPLERPYHIDLGFRVADGGRARTSSARPSEPFIVDNRDRRILSAIEEGLPLVPRPYHALARRLGWTEAQVLNRLETLIDAGVISRFGCILRHRVLGYTANAMAVWDVPDDQVDAIAEKLAACRGVTLCYRRRRQLPDWPYNLFAMFHGRERNKVLVSIALAKRAARLEGFPNSILFSNRCFKQRSARILPSWRGAT